MNLLPDSGSGPESRRSGSGSVPFVRTLPEILSAALVAVAFLQWLPVLAFFFPVPLFCVLFRSGKYRFMHATVAAFVLDVAAGTGMLVLQKNALSGAVLAASGEAALFILPMLCVVLPMNIRFRYRIAIAGLVCTLGWVSFIFLSGAYSSISDLVRSAAEETSLAINSMVPAGFDRTQLDTQFSPAALADMLLRIISCSVLPVCTGIYGLGCFLGNMVARKMAGTRVPRLDLASFYNDFWLFVPLIGGMIGVIAGSWVSSKFLSAVSWNVLLVSASFFFLQGLGISLFFSRRRQRPGGLTRFFRFLFLALLVLTGGWLWLCGLLMITGVAELFVPLRSRFDNKDNTDPTPGRGIDHK